MHRVSSRRMQWSAGTNRRVLRACALHMYARLSEIHIFAHQCHPLKKTIQWFAYIQMPGDTFQRLLSLKDRLDARHTYAWRPSTRQNVQTHNLLGYTSDDNYLKILDPHDSGASKPARQPSGVVVDMVFPQYILGNLVEGQSMG